MRVACAVVLLWRAGEEACRWACGGETGGVLVWWVGGCWLGRGGPDVRGSYDDEHPEQRTSTHQPSQAPHRPGMLNSTEVSRHDIDVWWDLIDIETSKEDKFIMYHAGIMHGNEECRTITITVLPSKSRMSL